MTWKKAANGQPRGGSSGTVLIVLGGLLLVVGLAGQAVLAADVLPAADAGPEPTGESGTEGPSSPPACDPCREPAPCDWAKPRPWPDCVDGLWRRHRQDVTKLAKAAGLTPDEYSTGESAALSLCQKPTQGLVSQVAKHKRYAEDTWSAHANELRDYAETHLVFCGAVGSLCSKFDVRAISTVEDVDWPITWEQCVATALQSDALPTELRAPVRTQADRFEKKGAAAKLCANPRAPEVEATVTANKKRTQHVDAICDYLLQACPDAVGKPPRTDPK